MSNVSDCLDRHLFASVSAVVLSFCTMKFRLNYTPLLKTFSQLQMPQGRNLPQSTSEGIRNEMKKPSTVVYSVQNPPPENAKILLHSCCAPCSGAMFEQMLSEGYDVTIFFYNPNIHPREEYNIRKEENKRYALKYGVDFVDCDYDSKSWFSRMKGLEYDPERGGRCTACFDMRMDVTAAYAIENGFDTFTTTNATSRWKDQSQVNGSGIRAARPHFPKLKFWVYDWQTDAMTKRKYDISVEERFYKQEYCGCSYSLRDSNIWRVKNGIDKVKIGGKTAGLGTRYFVDAEKDAAEESQEVVDAFFRDAQNQFGDENRLEKLYKGREKHSKLVDLNNW